LTTPPSFDPRDRKTFIFHATVSRKVLLALIRAAFSLVMELRVEGRENYPLDGAVIIAANHITNYDAFSMQFALPRPIFYMGKAELFNFILDPFLRNLGVFPVYRGEKDEWAMRHAAKVLARGQTLGMFPEGTRSQGRGLNLAKTGTARLAIAANCPIVPMTVTGTDTVFKGLRRAQVTIKLLPPILPNPNDTPLSLTDRLMFALASGLPVEMRGVYADVPKGFERVR
jgi:1-acyl-sn-glycerol-3-phosphate acyltransferase